jgi:hypothetical protein
VCLRILFAQTKLFKFQLASASESQAPAGRFQRDRSCRKRDSRSSPSSPSAVELLLHLASAHGAANVSLPTQLSDSAPAIEDDEVIVDAAELKRRVRKG